MCEQCKNIYDQIDKNMLRLFETHYGEFQSVITRIGSVLNTELANEFKYNGKPLTQDMLTEHFYTVTRGIAMSYYMGFMLGSYGHMDEFAQMAMSFYENGLVEGKAYHYHRITNCN